MLRTRIALSFFLLTGSIVVPTHGTVNQIQSGKGGSQWADGSPMPLPKPTVAQVFVADGSPMPLPKPTGVLVADGSPMPLPKPNLTAADGSPMPLPKPTLDVLVADGSPMPLPKPTIAVGV